MTFPTTTTEDKEVVEGHQERPPSSSPKDETRENQHRYLISALLAKQGRIPSPLVVEQAPSKSTREENDAKEASQVNQGGASTPSTPARARTTLKEAQEEGEEERREARSSSSPPPQAAGAGRAPAPTSPSRHSITKKKITAPPEVKKRNTPRNNIDSTSRRAMALQHQWEDMFRRLMLYTTQHGHCLVPNRYNNDRQLGAWVSTQRRNSGKGLLAASRKSRLDAMGFVWKTSDPRATPWTERYDELVEFYKSFGHSIVPILFDANRPLANWVSCQRQEYRYFVEDKPSRMTAERIKLLSKVDFVWDALRHRAPTVASKVLDENKSKREDREEDSADREERPIGKKPRQGQAPRPQPRVLDTKQRAIEAHREAVEAQRKAVEAQRRAERAQRTLEREEAAEAALQNGGSIMIHVGEDEDQQAVSNFESDDRDIWVPVPGTGEVAKLYHRRDASVRQPHLFNGSGGISAGFNATKFFQEQARAGGSSEDPSHQDRVAPRSSLSSTLKQQDGQDDAGTSNKEKKRNKMGDQSYSPQAYAEQSPPFTPMPVTSTIISVPQARPPTSSFYQQRAPSPTAIYVPHNAHSSMSRQQAPTMMAQHQQHQVAAGQQPPPNQHLMTAAAAVAAEQNRHQQNMLRSHHDASLMNSALAQQQQLNMAMARNAIFRQQQQQQHSHGATDSLGNLDRATILRLHRGGSLR